MQSRNPMDIDLEKLEALIDLQLLLSYAARAVGALILLVFGLVLAGWVRRLVRKAADKRKLDPTLSRFLATLVRYAIILMTLLSCLSLFGINTTSFAAVVGAAGLAIGLALQGTLGNLAAGMLLIAFRPFRVGDYVRTAGESGTVEEITLFTTLLKTPDNRMITIPNGPVFNNTIENVTLQPIRRCDIAIGVEYSADLKKTREVLHAVFEGLDEVLTEPPAPGANAVVLTGLGTSSVDWAIRVWTTKENYWGLREKMLERMKTLLDEAGIGIPFPQMDVHVDHADRRAA